MEACKCKEAEGVAINAVIPAWPNPYAAEMPLFVKVEVKMLVDEAAAAELLHGRSGGSLDARARAGLAGELARVVARGWVAAA